MRNDDSVCAVVVTYNRRELLIKCLNALENQTRPLQAIFVIDNASSDGTEELLYENGYILNLPPSRLDEPWRANFVISKGSCDRIYYIKMNNNIGGAGGFYEGMRGGYENGYDWIWNMDDDCLVEATTLENLFNNIASKSNIYCPLVLSADDLTTPVWNKGIARNTGKYEVKSIAFNGFLISSDTIKEIGFPIKEYFIYGDDVEYSYRAIAQGKKIYVVSDSILYHPYKHVEYIRKYCIRLPEYELSKLRVYYATRNNLLIANKYRGHIYSFKGILKIILKYIILGEWSLVLLKAIAVYDGLVKKVYIRDLK